MLGLDPHAWETWLAYRKKIKKPLREVSFDAAQKRLASFGDHEAQMESVLTSIANGWQGVFPPGKKAPSVVKADARAKERAAFEIRAFDDLKARAKKVGYRQPLVGEDLIGYGTLVRRAEWGVPR